MKVVTAIVRPGMLDDVTRELISAGAGGMTVSEVLGCGQQHGHAQEAPTAERGVLLLPKARIDVVVRDEDAAAVAETIAKSARTGIIGDGKIWVCPVDEVLRVRTGERDDNAV